MSRAAVVSIRRVEGSLHGWHDGAMDFEFAETADGMADKEVGEVHTRMKRVEPGEVVMGCR